MNPISIASFLLYVLITSFTPGPNNIMAMLFANQFGFKQTFKFCLGVGGGFFVISVFSSYFNLLLHNFIPKIELPMKILAAGYMLYLAYKVFTSKSNGNNGNGGKYNSFIAGMLLQFINPKGVLYSITVVSVFILPYYQSTIAFILFALFLGLIGLLSTTSWSLFGSVFQKFLSNYRRQFNGVMALLLVYCAVAVFI